MSMAALGRKRSQRFTAEMPAKTVFGDTELSPPESREFCFTREMHPDLATSRWPKFQVSTAAKLSSSAAQAARFSSA